MFSERNLSPSALFEQDDAMRVKALEKLIYSDKLV